MKTRARFLRLLLDLSWRAHNTVGAILLLADKRIRGDWSDVR